MYYQRLATLEDTPEIASLWEMFLQERLQQNESRTKKSGFDYLSYIKQKIESPATYGFLLEYGESGEIVGFLFVYVKDETLGQFGRISSPVQPRRIGGASGLYVKPEHRKTDSISLLINAGMQLAKELRLSDIDLLIGTDQTGIHKLLERLGFQQQAVKYSLHLEISEDQLQPFNPSNPKMSNLDDYPAYTIPLKDPKTQEIVLSPNGEQIFLEPVKDENNNVLCGKNGLPIYLPPLRDPETQELIFNSAGKIILCPLETDSQGNILEKNGMVCFQKPLWKFKNNKIVLQTDDNGNYLFANSD